MLSNETRQLPKSNASLAAQARACGSGARLSKALANIQEIQVSQFELARWQQKAKVEAEIKALENLKRTPERDRMLDQLRNSLRQLG